jgi:CO/xanthine dehydrogenase FAD-binding subunit
VKFPAFRYGAPTTVNEAIDLLASDVDARPLAGGQSLLPLMAFRLSVPTLLVDLNRVQGLDSITETNGDVRIGAMVRQATCEQSSVVSAKLPLLHQSLSYIAHPAIRTRGTIGGSLSHADTAAELPTVMTALDATMRVQGRGGSRSIPASEFFTGHFSNAMESTELLTAVDIPASGFHWKFAEVCRRHGDFALAMVAVGVRMESDRCLEARIALGAVADRPVRATEAEAMLADAVIDGEMARTAATAAASTLSPPADVHASSAVRAHLAQVLVERTLLDAARGM